MKKYVMLVVASIFMLSMSAMAQDQNQGNRGKGERQQLSAATRAENLAKELNLTDEQKTQVQALYEKNDAAFAKLRSEGDRSNPDFREKFKALRDAQDKELAGIIGTEKYDQYQKARAERMQKMREGRNSN